MDSVNQIVVLGRDVLPSVIRLEKGVSREVVFVAPKGVSGTFDVTFELAGPGANLALYGIYLCEGDQKVDFRVNVRHLCGGCTSHQLFKGLAQDSAQVSSGEPFVASFASGYGAEPASAGNLCR